MARAEVKGLSRKCQNSRYVLLRAGIKLLVDQGRFLKPRMSKMAKGGNKETRERKKRIKPRAESWHLCFGV